MKKYLTSGALAIIACGFMTSCHETEIDYASQIEAKKATFAENFVNFYGEIDPNQDWGFGTTTRGITRSGNTAGDYTPWPSTHQYYDANGKLIASANMNHNQWGSTDLQSMPYGGWIVPDPLTEGQKLRVQKYFQANPNLSYQDPHYANFYVQQVYTGGTDAPTTGNKEETAGANGQTHKGMTLNQLTVGAAGSHINDFNAGTCTTSQVLNHEGKTQNDQITLMLNVDDTSCFGFHETSGSNVQTSTNHNDKMALVSAAVIDAWAAENGNPGEAVTDKWNRSFMGFDYELLPESDIVTDTYVKLTNWDGNRPEYAWDGETVMKIGQNTGGANVADLNITNKLADKASSWDALGVYKQNGSELSQDAQGNWLWDGQNFTLNLNQDVTNYKKLVIEFAEATPKGCNFQVGYTGGSASWNQNLAQGITKVEVEFNNVSTLTKLELMNGSGGGNFKIKNIYLTSGANEVYYTSEYLLAGGTDQICFYSTNTNMYGGVTKTVSSADMTTTVDGKTCINLKYIKDELLDKGYHPITTDLKTWVKWQAACDGYYSDWIVTLTEAKRISETTTTGGTITTGQTTTDRYLRKHVLNHRWVFCEDLGQASNRKDFDYNDLVFDAKIIQEYAVTKIDNVETEVAQGSPYALITPLAAGGELSITVADKNVHEMFGLSDAVLINTIDPNTESDVRSSGVLYAPTDPGRIDCQQTATYPTDNIIDIPINVQIYNNALQILARKGEAPHKIAVTPGTRWAQERVDINEAQPGFADWVKNVNVGATFWSSSASPKRYPYMPTDEYLINDMTNLRLPDVKIDGETTTNYSVNLASNEVSLWFGEEQLYSGSAGVQISYATLFSGGVAEGSIIRIYGVSNSSWELNVSNINGSEAWSDQKSGNSALFGYVEFKLNASSAELLRNSSGMAIKGNGLTILCVSIDNTLVRNTSN